MEQPQIGWPTPAVAGYELYPWQARMCNELLAGFHAHRSLIGVAPTATGKTLIAAELSRLAATRGRVLVIAQRDELVKQACRKIEKHSGLSIGMEMGKYTTARDMPQVVVGTVQTLKNARRRLHLTEDEFSLIITDECHHSTSASHRIVIDHFKRAKHLGLTATACRLDGAPLGDVFEDIIVGITPQEATDQGYIVPAVYMTPPTPHELAELRKQRGGDYNPEEAAKYLDKADIIGDVVGTYKKVASDRLAIYFATTVQHSIDMAESFRDNGVRAAHIDKDTPEHERDMVWKDLRCGALQVVVNVGLAVEGIDIEEISCVGLVRPTASYQIAQQQRGRGLRLCERLGKKDCLFLDHARITDTHGLVTDPVAWSLSGRPVREKAAAESPKTLRTCLGCYLWYPAMLLACPSCGWTPPPPKTKDKVVLRDMELRRAEQHILEARKVGQFAIHAFLDEVEYIGACPDEVEPQRLTVLMRGNLAQCRGRKVRIRSLKDYIRLLLPPKDNTAEKQFWFDTWSGIANKRGYKAGWIHHKFWARFHAAIPREWMG